METLAQTSTAWDGSPYGPYPAGNAELTVARITIPAYTTMDWHSHAMPIAGYILSGTLTLEKPDGTTRSFSAGEAPTETIHAVHRGHTGPEPVLLIAFYAGTPGQPLSVPEEPPGSTKPPE